MKTKQLSLLALGLAAGCHLQPSVVRNPAPSPEGIAVTLVGEDCEDHIGVEGDPVSRDPGVKVRIDNPTGRPLRINEDAIRLVLEHYSTGIGPSQVVQVPPHGTATVTVDFIHHELCDSDRQFTLAWNDAFLLENHLICLADLAFLP